MDLSMRTYDGYKAMDYDNDWWPLTQLRGELVEAIPRFQAVRDLERYDDYYMDQLLAGLEACVSAIDQRNPSSVEIECAALISAMDYAAYEVGAEV